MNCPSGEDLSKLHGLANVSSMPRTPDDIQPVQILMVKASELDHVAALI